MLLDIWLPFFAPDLFSQSLARVCLGKIIVDLRQNGRALAVLS